MTNLLEDKIKNAIQEINAVTFKLVMPFNYYINQCNKYILK